MFFVRSAEQHICPVCEHDLFVIGSRERKGRKPSGERITYIIRRLRCESCEKIHHELPNLFVPYKRYEAAGIESVLSHEQNSDVAADESTLYRWRLWFAKFSSYWMSCLSAIAASTVRTFTICTPTDRTLCRSRQWLAGETCPTSCSFSIMGTYPFCLLVLRPLR